MRCPGGMTEQEFQRLLGRLTLPLIDLQLLFLAGGALGSEPWGGPPPPAGISERVEYLAALGLLSVFDGGGVSLTTKGEAALRSQTATRHELGSQAWDEESDRESVAYPPRAPGSLLGSGYRHLCAVVDEPPAGGGDLLELRLLFPGDQKPRNPCRLLPAVLLASARFDVLTFEVEALRAAWEGRS